MGRGAESYRPVGIANQPAIPFPHAVRPLECVGPLLVHVLGGVEPRLLLAVEAAVRPRLMGVAREEEPFPDAEAPEGWGPPAERRP